MLKKVLISLISIFLLSSMLYSFDKISIFNKANNFYSKGEYNKAINLYLDICKEPEYANGYIFYNIGTSYLKLNKIGDALYWLSKAKFFIPLDSYLIKNYQIAQSKVIDSIPDKSLDHYISTILFLNNLLSINFLFYFTILSFNILILLLILKLFVSKKNIRKILKRFIYVISFLLFVFATNFIWSYYKLNFLKIGFIKSAKCELKNDFNEQASTIAQLHDGTKVYILDKRENSLHVKLSNGVDGWLNKKNVVF